MYKKGFALNLSRVCGIDFVEQLPLLKEAGFLGFFVIGDPGVDLQGLTQRAQELGMVFQSIHAPWDMAAQLWHAEEAAAAKGVEKLCRCVDDCVQCGVPVLVVHPFVGFDRHDVTEIGLERYGRVVAHARKQGIRIAFENVEGDEFLQALMNHFREDATVGFCWDTGHEMCYNRSVDQLALYGDRLICTHLNDNLGISDPQGNITWLDDLHVLPFDGAADWEGIARRLREHKFDGMLTFELNLKSKPGRHENDAYGQMAYTAFLAQAYQRACRISSMLTQP